MHALSRILSKLGVASRTEAADMIAAGRVAVNGRPARDPEQPTDELRDRVEVDGRPVTGAEKVYLAMHKPAGVLTTARDPENRPTVYGLLPKKLGARVFPVGRLDGPTAGLLLFTNDTLVGDTLTNPDIGVPKTYEFKVKGQVTPAELERLKQGVTLDVGTETLPAQCRILSSNAGSTRLELTIREGKNRQVRRMGLAIGHEVVKLRRTRVGPVELGDLPSGQCRPLTAAEIRSLRAIGQRKR
ncbi:MAG: rRNA pseudouridine synthase [Planctomycetes bacterium]|nr:rRNA pseudouridine synthase [Planctomycetota bacterium]